MKKLFILSTLAVFVLYSTKQWHLDKKNKNGSKASRKKTIKPYDKVITKDAISDDGLFMVHSIKYYFEIPNKLLDKDMLWSADRNYLNLGGGYVNAGSETNEQLVIKAFKIKF
jgi:hypothetical protein